MNPLLALLIFSILWLIPSAFLAPTVYTLLIENFASQTANSRTKLLALSLLAIAIGTALTLLTTSLVARAIPNYIFAVPVSYAIILLLSLLCKKHLTSTQAQSGAVKYQWLYFVYATAILTMITLVFWIARWSFSDIHFDTGHFGAEKLFNLSLQQSFTYGTGYPPQSLWLAGEPEAYYILPRILPGLATHFSVNYLHTSSSVAGLFFHLSDAFYNALAISVLFAAIMAFVSQKSDVRLQHIFFASFGAFLPFLAAPARALSQWWQGNIDLWSLSRIIPNTINEYPFWNWVWADNHAHSNAAFLDITLAFLILFSIQKSKIESRNSRIFLGIIIGTIATTLFMSQSGSAFIALCLYFPLVSLSLFLNSSSSGREFFRPSEVFVIAIITAIITAIPDLVSRDQVKVTWTLVPNSMHTTIVDFANVHFTYLSILCFCSLAFCCVSFKRELLFRNTAIVVCSAASIAALTIFNQQIIGLTALFAMLCLVPAQTFSSKNKSLALIAAIAVFIILATPEIIAANFNMGADLVRLNTVFKFVFASFFLMPLFIAFIWTLEPIILPRFVTKWIAPTATIFLTVVLLLVNFSTLMSRVTRVNPSGGPTGIEFLSKTLPDDKYIIDFLDSLPQNSIIAEECGVPSKPGSYGIPGRISAYSGRPALCGWGIHTSLHHTNFKAPPLRGLPVWPHLLAIDAATNAILDTRINSPESMASALEALNVLKSAGATHLVIGTFEHKQHPTASISDIASVIGGDIAYRSGNFGVIKLP